MIDRPDRILSMSGLDGKVDWEERTVYVRGLATLGEKLGMNWSPLAEEAEWGGWRWRDVGRG
jgi:hypothetical protein